MVKFSTFLLVFSIIFGYSQNYNDVDSEFLVNREAKASEQRVAISEINPNTINYDLVYQRIELNLSPDQNYVTGKMTAHFKPLSTLNTIYFDLTNELGVTEVNYHGSPVNFLQLATHEIQINLPSSLVPNIKDSLEIKYQGVPSNANDAFYQSFPSAGPSISTLSEPYGAQDWFPTKQSLTDKVERVDMLITAPSSYRVAGNGVLQSEIDLGNGQKTTFWKSSYPIATYLIAFSLGTFTVSNDVMGNPPFPYVNYLYPSTAGSATINSNLQWAKNAMATFEEFFGPYPFRNEKYGHMEYNYQGVCMEHQTMSSMSGWNKNVVAHEMAHQWFGDKVTCRTWNDIWLNEGFAVFGEHVVQEKLLLTQAQFMSYLDNQINNVTSATSGSVYVPDSQLSDINRIFSGRLTYAKGGYLVRMMKWILGETQFYNSLKAYHSTPQYAYGFASTTDLKNSFLSTSGFDFTNFLNQWFYGEGYPVYTIKYKPNATNSKIALLVTQTQSHPSVAYFQMPLPIKITGTGGQIKYYKLWNTVNNQYYFEDLGFPVASVEFNYERQILTKNAQVLYEAGLSVKDIDANTEIQIYPNPATEFIEIKGMPKKGNFQIFDASGRLIREDILNINNRIEVKNLAIGKYILYIDSTSYPFIKK